MAKENEQAEPAPNFVDVATFTAAGCQVHPTAWVLQLVLSDVSSVPGGLAEVPRFKAGLPWPLAKAVHQIMGAAIDQYERQEGPIAVPRSIQGIINKEIEHRKVSDQGPT